MTEQGGSGFRGWWVLGGGFVNAVILAGAALYAFGLYVEPLQTEFGLSREQANYGYLALYVSIMFWAVTIGRLVERVSARTLSLLGGVSFAAGALIIAYASDPRLMILAVLGPIGFALTASGPFMANVLATRWFTRQRGRALGISSVSTSVGGFLIVPLATALFVALGWRDATAAMAVGFGAVVVGLTILLVRARPEDIGQRPDGDALTDAAQAVEDTPSPPQRTFWLIALGAGLLLSSDTALLTSLIPYGADRGFSPAQTAALMSTVTGSAVAGKLLVGWLAERFDKRWLFALVCASHIGFLLTILASPPFAILLGVGGLVGMAIGGVYPVWTTLTAERFGRERFARAIGVMNLVTVPLVIVAITLIGRTFDLTGSYDLAFKIFIPQVLIAAALVFLLPKRAA